MFGTLHGDEPASSAELPDSGSTENQPKPSFMRHAGSGTTLNIHWTGYYVPRVAITESGKTVNTTDKKGTRYRFHISNKDFRVVEMEGSGSVIDPEGKTHYGFRERRGVWTEMPANGLAMGNRSNGLAALKHIATDQKRYPFGSLVFVPALVGETFGDSEPMDGYLWVADVGGMIHGKHFDLFVGESAAYSDFLNRDKRKENYPTVFYRIPNPPKGKNPRTHNGLIQILHDESLLTTTQPKPESLKSALLAYQKEHPHIPEAEHGNPRAATTLWTLIQTALDQQSKAQEAADQKE